MDRAVLLALFGPAYGPNPRVGCVITDKDGVVLAEGFHRGVGNRHAEVDAIENAREAGISIVGATAHVTLEPCSHTGRTGPCTDALAAAEVARVVYAVADPGSESGGGARVLESSGVDVTFAPATGAESVNRRWVAAMTMQRPFVIVKFAVTLDGRTSAADGSSFWVTGEDAREHAHAERADAGAIIVGTGTVLADEPMLTARPGGMTAEHQPLRVVMGLRETELTAASDAGAVVYQKTHDPAAVLAALWERDVRVAIVEGGATVTTAFLRAGLVDEVHAYVAPVILGSGTSAVADIGIATMADALRLEGVTQTRLGADTLIVGTPPKKG
jgi:diaminohydroxyphosphoribosylaminopyrimidine deaminase/5-amino-6-(5-phosphoribosylamino)uracil reductase